MVGSVGIWCGVSIAPQRLRTAEIAAAWPSSVSLDLDLDLDLSLLATEGPIRRADPLINLLPASDPGSMYLVLDMDLYQPPLDPSRLKRRGCLVDSKDQAEEERLQGTEGTASSGASMISSCDLLVYLDLTNPNPGRRVVYEELTGRARRPRVRAQATDQSTDAVPLAPKPEAAAADDDDDDTDDCRDEAPSDLPLDSEEGKSAAAVASTSL